MRLKRQKLLEGKASALAGGDAAGDLRGLDDHRATAAAGGVQRHRCLAARVPAAGGHHGGGERFLERSVALVLAPAALEQRLARGVDIDGGFIGGQVQDRKSTRLNPSHSQNSYAPLFF